MRVFALIAFFISSNLFAAEMNGVTFKDTQSLGGKTLLLNGMGARLATIFKFKVYVGALYLESKSQVDTEVLASTGIKKIVMHFVRDIDSDKLVEAWKEGFDKNGGERFSSELVLLQNWTAKHKEVKISDVLVFNFLKDKVSVEFFLSGQTALNDKIEIPNAQLSMFLPKLWLGEKPPNPELKDGLLGITKK